MKTKAELSASLAAKITDALNKQNTASRVRAIIQEIIDSSLNKLDDPTWTQKVVQLSQNNVRSFSIDNGFLVYSAQGEGKVVAIRNPMIRFNNPNFQAGMYTPPEFEIYSYNGSGLFKLSSINVMGEDVSNNLYHFDVGALQQEIDKQVLNDDLWIYASQDISLYLGTATLIFDYKIFDLN